MSTIKIKDFETGIVYECVKESTTFTKGMFCVLAEDKSLITNYGWTDTDDFKKLCMEKCEFEKSIRLFFLNGKTYSIKLFKELIERQLK